MKLTVMEIKILNAMRNNEYNDALDSFPLGTWSFTAIDNSGIKPNIARGVISSLVKKGLVYVHEGGKDKNAEPEVIGFEQAGVDLFKDADGEECQWEGPKLLKEMAEITTTGDEEKPGTPIPKDEVAATLDKDDKKIIPIPESKPNTFTLALLVDEIKMDPRKARKILRDNKIPKLGKHYEWETQKEYDEIKLLLCPPKEPETTK
jgi:hypothetical protein